MTFDLICGRNMMEHESGPSECETVRLFVELYRYGMYSALQ